MGFVKRVTGQQQAIDHARKQAKEQAAAMAQTAAAEAATSVAAAAQMARDQQTVLAREQAAAAAAEALNVPIDQAEVRLDTTATSTADVIRRRAVFGTNPTSGFSL